MSFTQVAYEVLTDVDFWRNRWGDDAILRRTDQTDEWARQVSEEIGKRAGEQLTRALAALDWLVDLKDGPRDQAYGREKPLAWDLAREVLDETPSDPEDLNAIIKPYRE